MAVTTVTLTEVPASANVVASVVSTAPEHIGARTDAQPFTVVRAPTMQQLQDDDEELDIPRAFKTFLFVVSFVFMARYTVVLPTVHDYTASLGGNGWFAGLIVASSLITGLLSIPIANTYLLQTTYKPALALLCSFGVIGNALYGLGQLLNSKWILLTGQIINGLWWGGCGRSLMQHVAFACAGKRKRSAWTATQGNMSFLGMGFGPVIAAALSKVNFSMGLLQVDEFTNPGWFFCVIWILMLTWLAFIPEPDRPFQTPQQSSNRATSTLLPNTDILWSLFGVWVTSATVATWESSAAIVTQKYFDWSIMTSSLFIGGVFFTSSLGGEVTKVLVLRYDLSEADVTAVGLATIVAGSAMLYWYLPTSKHEAAGDVSELVNTVSYVIGSLLVLNAASFARNYSVVLAMRKAAAVSNEMKDMTVGLQAFFMMIGRSAGALCGMGVSTLPGGADAAAALMTGMSAVLLAVLLVPGKLTSLRNFD